MRSVVIGLLGFLTVLVIGLTIAVGLLLSRRDPIADGLVDLNNTVRAVAITQTAAAPFLPTWAMLTETPLSLTRAAFSTEGAKELQKPNDEATMMAELFPPMP